MTGTLHTDPRESLGGHIPSLPRSPEETYQILMNANPIPMWVYDRDTLGFLEVNDATVQQYGYSRAEFLSMSIADIRPVRDASRLLEFSRLLKQAVPPRPGSYAAGIWRHRRKDGTLLDAEIIGSPVPYAGRRAVVILAMDVTERLRSEAEAAERTRMATLIGESGTALGGALMLGEGLRQCAEILARRMPAPFVRIWTLNKTDGVLDLQASTGARTPMDSAQERIPVGVCRIGRIASEAKSLRTNMILEDPVPPADGVCDREWARSQGITAFAGFPLMVEGHVVGVAAAYADRNLTDAAIQGFESVADGIAQFIDRKRAETALRESEERVRLLLDSTAEAIVGIDLDGNSTLANRACLRMLGCEDAGALAGKNAHALMHHSRANGDPYPQAECEILSALRAGQEYHSDSEVFWRADGGSFPAEYWSHPVFKDGQITGAVVTFLDITERKQAEEEQRKLALLVESSDDFISMASPDGKVTYLNEGGCRLIGLDRPREAIGVDISRFHTERAWARIEQEVIPTAMRTGRWQGEIQLRHWKTGAPIDALMNAFLVRRRGTGEPVCLATVIRDITERKRAEAEMRKLAAVIENSTDLIAMASPEGRILFVNPAGLKVLGVNRNDEVLGDSVLQYVAPEDRENFQKDGWSSLLRDGHSENEVRLLNRKTGAYVSMLQNNFFVTDPESGRVVALATISRDISDRKRVEETLRAAKEAAESANRVKSEFLANMSHEIRTPMNGILGMADLALDTELNPEQREYIETVKLSANDLLTVINEILDFSKIEAGKLPLETADFDLYRMVNETVRLLRPVAAQKGLEMISRISPGVPRRVRGDVTRLRQVITNLLGNAIKFTPSGQVALSVETEPGSVQGVLLHVVVRDTGIGIPPEKQKLIFEAFTQADGSMTRRFGGTGLGLSISKRLVEMMDGRIWVESGEPGAGSNFHFTALLGNAAPAAG